MQEKKPTILGSGKRDTTTGCGTIELDRIHRSARKLLNLQGGKLLLKNHRASHPDGETATEARKIRKGHIPFYRCDFSARALPVAACIPL